MKKNSALNADNRNPKIPTVWNAVYKWKGRWFHKIRLKTGKATAGELLAGIKTWVAGFFLTAVLLSILLVLPASQSRAAWLAVLASAGFLLAFKYKDSFIDWSNKPVFKNNILVLLIAGIMVSGLAGMYFLKKDSANGRLFIWKVTLKMIGDYPLTGTGFGGFKARYTDYQAAWFK